MNAKIIPFPKAHAEWVWLDIEVLYAVHDEQLGERQLDRAQHGRRRLDEEEVEDVGQRQQNRLQDQQRNRDDARQHVTVAELAARVDELVTLGVVSSRSDAVRIGLERLLDEHRRRRVAEAIVAAHKAKEKTIQAAITVDVAALRDE